jgi:hypothetical protein
MAINLTGIFSDVGNLASGITMQDIIQQVAIGSLGTVALAGAQTQAGQDALDPLHIFHHAPSNTTGVVTGPVMPGSQFAALPAATQQALLAAHYTNIPG